MPLPPKVDDCDCGADRSNVDETVDGITVRYECGACGALLLDDTLGAEP